MSEYYFDDTATVYAHGSSGGSSSVGSTVTSSIAVSSAAAMAGLASTAAPTNAYYYVADDGSQAYSYGSSGASDSRGSSRSSSDFTQAAVSQGEQFYDDGSFYYDYEG